MEQLTLKNKEIVEKTKTLSLNKLLIFIYLFISFLSNYNTIYKKNFLICIIMLSFYFFIVNFNQNKKINFFAILLIFSLIFSLIFNIDYFLYYLINIFCIISCYFIAKFYRQYSLKIIFYLFSLFNFINFNFYFFLDGNFASPKYIYGIMIKRKFFPFLNLSTASLIAIFCIVTSFFDKKYLKRRIRIFNVILSGYIILNCGKLTIFFSLLVLIFVRIYALLIKKMKIFIKVFLLICFSSSLIYFFISKYLINYSRIFTGRNILWIDYWNYIFFNKEKIIFGYGFFNMQHPHNQFLSMIYILGLFGLLAYLLLFYKALINSYYHEKTIFYLLIYLVVLMIGDDYFVLTVFPIYSLIIFQGIYSKKYREI